MKKSFKKLGFVSLATSSVLLGSMNATDLETYAALQKPSHVFGNYAAKKDGNKSPALEAGGSGKEGNSGSQASQQQAQTTASSGTPNPETTPTKEGPSSSSSDKHTTSSGTPNPETTPTKEGPSSSGSSVASQLVKDANTVNSFSSVSVSGMNTTLSGVETIV
ncbi:hypothetical protein HpVa146_10390 [Helicobacter pylori]